MTRPAAGRPIRSPRTLLTPGGCGQQLRIETAVGSLLRDPPYDVREDGELTRTSPAWAMRSSLHGRDPRVHRRAGL